MLTLFDIATGILAFVGAVVMVGFGLYLVDTLTAPGVILPTALLAAFVLGTAVLGGLVGRKAGHGVFRLAHAWAERHLQRRDAAALRRSLRSGAWPATGLVLNELRRRGEDTPDDRAAVLELLASDDPAKRSAGAKLFHGGAPSE